MRFTLNGNSTLNVAKALKALDVKLSIDDFGTGYSSITYLRDFPFYEIKIDRSFVSKMMDQEEDAVIIRTSIDMIHSIGGRVVAEGVEDEQTGKQLSDMGCDYLQGVHFSRPLPPDQLEQWLAGKTG